VTSAAAQIEPRLVTQTQSFMLDSVARRAGEANGVFR